SSTWNRTRSARTPSERSERAPNCTWSRTYGPTLETVSFSSIDAAPRSTPAVGQLADGAAPLQLAKLRRWSDSRARSMPPVRSCVRPNKCARWSRLTPPPYECQYTSTMAYVSGFDRSRVPPHRLAESWPLPNWWRPDRPSCPCETLLRARLSTDSGSAIQGALSACARVRAPGFVPNGML